MRQHGQACFQRPFRVKMPEANGICADNREKADVMSPRHLMRRGDVPFAVVTHGAEPFGFRRPLRLQRLHLAPAAANAGRRSRGDDISADRTDKKADAAQIAAGGLRLIEQAGQKRFDIRLQNVCQNGQRFNIRDTAPPFPFRDSLVCDADSFRQRALGHPARKAQLPDQLAGLNLIHENPSRICNHHTRTNPACQETLRREAPMLTRGKAPGMFSKKSAGFPLTNEIRCGKMMLSP